MFLIVLLYASQPFLLFASFIYVRGGETARVNIWYEPHQNFRYPIYSVRSRQNKVPW